MISPFHGRNGKLQLGALVMGVGLLVLPFLFFAPPAAGQSAEIPVFSLNSGDVPKVVVFFFKPDRIYLEVTYSKEKQAELATLTQNGLPKTLRIALNGKVATERVFTQASTGHSMKIDMPSMEEALRTVQSLWVEAGKKESP